MIATRVALLSLLLAPSLAFGQSFALKDGDHVVFYGDDITDDGQYARAVEEYVATRFPSWNVDFYYAGVGGDKVGGGEAGSSDLRLDRDVIAAHASVVTIMLGMNDGGYRPFDQGLLDAYGQGYRRILGRLAEALPGVRLFPLGPSPFDDVTRPPVFVEGYNGVLRRYGKLVEEVAKERGANFVDLGAPLQTGLEKLNRVSPALARMIIPDRVRPGPAGHLVMAGALLRAWNAPPQVTLVEIDATAATAHLVRAENTEVTGLLAKELTWTQTDRALPLPVRFGDADVDLAETLGAGLEALDQQVLKITGLSKGSYELLIDGASLGRFSETELGQGVNLATRETPMLKQALAVRSAVRGRPPVQFVRRRLLVTADKDSKFAETATALEGLDARLHQDQRARAVPTPRRYEVRRSYALR
jgi:lysophospholipase L1-like esterase